MDLDVVINRRAIHRANICIKRIWIGDMVSNRSFKLPWLKKNKQPEAEENHYSYSSSSRKIPSEIVTIFI